MAPKKKSGNSDPRGQYFTAIKQQKLDTLRWCLRHGGITHRTEDDDGHTGLQVAAAGGYTEALEKLIEQVLKIGPQEDMGLTRRFQSQWRNSDQQKFASFSTLMCLWLPRTPHRLV